jgi:hypothetical protein
MLSLCAVVMSGMWVLLRRFDIIWSTFDAAGLIGVAVWVLGAPALLLWVRSVDEKTGTRV